MNRIKKWNVAILSFIVLIIWGIILLPENFKKKIIIEKKIICDTLYLGRNYELKYFCGQKAVTARVEYVGEGKPYLYFLSFPNPRGSGLIEVKTDQSHFNAYFPYNYCTEKVTEIRPVDCFRK